MASALKDLNAVNDAITINVSEASAGQPFGVQYPTGGTGTLVVEVTIDNTTWEDIGMVRSDDVAGTVVLSAAAAGFFTGSVPPCKSIRLRKSAGVGACIAGFAVGSSH